MGAPELEQAEKASAPNEAAAIAISLSTFIVSLVSSLDWALAPSWA